MLTGSCLCGSVAYEVAAEPGPIVHCHCATCRKTHGSAFSTVTNVPRVALFFARDLRGKRFALIPRENGSSSTRARLRDAVTRIGSCKRPAPGCKL